MLLLGMRLFHTVAMLVARTSHGVGMIAERISHGVAKTVARIALHGAEMRTTETACYLVPVVSLQGIVET